jgi:hypothetical protein
MRSTLIALLLLCESAMAHQWSPTYPELKPHYVGGTYVANMRLFNARNDVRFYEIEVFTADWQPMSFAANNKLIQIDTHKTLNVDVYIRKQDRNRVTYICTRSRTRKQDAEATVVASRVCSKVK